MEVGGRAGHISQTGHFELEAVRFFSGDIEPAQIRLRDFGRGPQIVADDAELLEHVAPDQYPLMAGTASALFEEAVALLLFLGERTAISAEIAVKP